MRYKKRYFLLVLEGDIKLEEAEKMLFSTINKVEPFLAIRSNMRIIKERTKIKDEKVYMIISANNEYKHKVIFALSLISKFYKANLLTIKNSGNIKKINSFEF